MSQMTVIVDKERGALLYLNNKGKEFLSKNPERRVFKESTVQGEPCYRVEQSFKSPIPFEWNEQKQMLVVGKRQGGF